MAGAGQLLHADPGVKLTAFCAAVGCHDTVQFIRDFKAQYGMTPAKCKRVNPQELNSGNTSN